MIIIIFSSTMPYYFQHTPNQGCADGVHGVSHPPMLSNLQEVGQNSVMLQESWLQYFS